ncbi:unnamed protein product [Lactuca virosa]|uniref:Uncharacterized protein n=1 Tax=Lactuca virosa TaxID=75947 RepID=A0AAU9NDE8_9ASTR|nr:unnamed protein product [Lactuca virosa]
MEALPILSLLLTRRSPNQSEEYLSSITNDYVAQHLGLQAVAFLKVISSQSFPQMVKNKTTKVMDDEKGSLEMRYEEYKIKYIIQRA